MPVIRQINSSVGLSGGVSSDVRIDNSVGEALGQLGNTITRAAGVEQEMMLRQERMKMENAEFRANQEFERFNSTMGVGFEEAKGSMDPSGEGFSEAVVKTFDEKSAEFLNTVPVGLRGKFTELAATARQEWINSSAKTEMDQRNTWFKNGVAERSEKLKATVFENPDYYDQALKEGAEFIDATGLPIPEKVELKRQWEQTITLTLAQSDLMNNPERIVGPQSPVLDGLTRAMIGVESSGDPTAESNKGASGLMQVMPSTAVEIAAEIGDRDFPSTLAQQKEYLKNPAVSIRYGQYYMNKMLQRYNGDVDAALVAYNGGPERADAWINSGRDDSVIPAETRDYRRDVVNSMRGTPAAGPSQSLEIVTSGKRGSAPDLENVEPSVISRFRKVQDVLGVQIPVVSGFRDPQRNANAGGAKQSQHMHGNALDLDVSGMSKEDRIRVINAASSMGFTGIGVYENSIHIDIGPRRFWGPDHRSGSLPAWASDAISQHMAGTAKVDASSGRIKLDPRFANLPLDQRLEIHSKAMDAAKARSVAQAAQAKANRDAAYDNLQLGIVMGDVTGEEQILADPNIDNGQKSTLIEKFRTAQKENAGVDELISAIASGDGATINTFDADQRKAADKAYEKITKSVSPDVRQSVTSSFVETTGYIPGPEVVAMRNAFASSNPNEIAGVLTKADAYERMAPQQFGSAEGFGDLKKGLDLYRAYTGSMGYSPQEAAMRIAQARQPENAKARDAILKSEQTKKALKDIDADDVAAIFDAGFFSAAPDVGVMSPQANVQLGVNQTSQAVIVSDYKAILEESLVDANGDMDVAKAIANERFQRSYGTSSMTLAGGNVVVRNPPEKTYPVGPDGTHNYVREQAVEALKGEGVEAADVYLMPYQQTSEDIKAGRPAQYQLYYKDAAGMLQMFPAPFYAEPQQVARRQAEQEVIRMNTLRRENQVNMQTEVQRRQAVDEAVNTTVGPDWMKARAAETVNDRFAQERGATTMSGVRQQMQDLRKNIDLGGGGGGF